MTVISKPDTYGYKFLIHAGANSWTAFRTVKGFKYFMSNYGLEIDRDTVQTFKDFEGNPGIHCQMKAHEVETCYFWNLEDIPEGSTPFIGMENGSYVNCYSNIKNGKSTIYKPNPNAKNVYIPYDHRAVSHQIYGEPRY